MSLGTFAEFSATFDKTFKRLDTVANALHWLATYRVPVKPDGSFDIENYLTNFQDKVSLAGALDNTVLIQYFASGLPPSLMKRIYSMDTPPETIDGWYKKASHFQVQWKCAKLVAAQHKSSHTNPRHFSTTTFHTKKEKDPDAMDVDAVSIGKLSPEE
jgi:hypothetical protein